MDGYTLRYCLKPALSETEKKLNHSRNLRHITSGYM